MASTLRIGKDGFELPLDVVTESVALLANKGSGKSYTSAVMIEEMHAAGIQVVALDHTGVYWGLTSNARGAGAGLPLYVLGGDHGNLPLEPHAGAFVADLVVDSGHSFVLDVSLFETAEEEHRFVTDFAKRLYRRKGAAKQRTILHFVIDEADEYAPQKPMGVQGNTMKRAVETLVRRGRSRGIGTTLISQRSAVLNKDVLNMVETLIVLRTVAPGDQEAIQKWISDKQVRDESGVMESLNKLPTGTAWFWSPQRSILKRVAVRRIKTYDSYRTPKPGEVLVEPTKRAELDLDALGEEMAATVERAKENDPDELRRRLRETEGKLTAALRGLETRVEPADLMELRAELEELRNRPAETVEVEVPVLSGDEILEVTTLTNRLSKLILEDAPALGAEVAAALAPIAGALKTVVEASARPAPPPPPVRPSGPLAVINTAPPPKPPPPPRPAVPTYEDGWKATGRDQKVLDGLAWWETVGVAEPTRGQLAFVVGYHQRSKGFTNAVSALSGRGLIHYPTQGLVALTDRGRAIARPPASAPTEEELRRLIFEQVGPNRTRMLGRVIEAGGEGLSREELAGALEYHPRSKGFTNALSSLSGLGLVEYPRPGWVRPTGLCYLNGSRG